jgi:hypothetical protein
VVEADGMRRLLQHGASRCAVRVEERGARPLNDGTDAACKHRLLAEAVHGVDVAAALTAVHEGDQRGCRLRVSSIGR